MSSKAKWSEFMNFKLRNFGKIAEADIKLDGITVICGNNNTGKSTVGKALFSFFNSLYDYKQKIVIERINTIRDFVSKSYSVRAIRSYDNFLNAISSHEGEYTTFEVKSIVESYFPVKISIEKVEDLTNYLNSDENEILDEYVFRYFNIIMNDQIKRTGSGNGKCKVVAEFRAGVNSVTFTSKKCTCSQDESLSNTAYYINSPFVLDFLNQYNFSLFGMGPLERNVVSAIQNAQAAINDNSMSGILESVSNKRDLEDVKKVLKQAFSGETRIDHGQYFYIENGFQFDFRNISAGLKSFALIERLLETGALKRKDVLILDEPEIHLHTEWQIIYAELIVMLQKKFDLTILLVTHSFQFLESLDFYMKQNEILDRGNYYIPESTDKGFVMKSCGNNPNELKQNLMKGSVKIADMEFDFDMEHGSDDT